MVERSTRSHGLRRAVITAWVAAVLLTLASAAWQRRSGPTYPVTVDVAVGDARVTGQLLRSHTVSEDQPVSLMASAPGIDGVVHWRRFPTAEPWETRPLTLVNGRLTATLPRQQAAGKLEYQVELRRAGQAVAVPERPAVTRFKGDVSPWLLVPHIACMFLALLCSARAGFGAFTGAPPGPWAVVALALWVLGGLILGPGVQKQAFDAWWTGIPFGTDLTDNKTLIAVIAWAWAAWRGRRGHRNRTAMVLAMLVTFVVFAIPHSTWGSEVDWGAAGQRR